ncbi:hypothetical protein F3Y22_tig00110422pilonHSYRG00044 [Hibiscus syriacus]|uniref:Uncharacterized protein n=1 Tax=Hibiscus syriacus TaxID=106335 RepID=A0A6A3AN08_HIBSY|nr:hypothetical protein F3Y22_tig00110422pilonHSYRG00044 [Hibiscus syriacus]
MSLKHHKSNSAAAQSLSFEDVADFFSLPLDDAASTLGVLVEAPRNDDEFKEIGRHTKGCRVCNMIEGGVTPLRTPEELKEMGFHLIVHSLTALYASARALIAGVLDALKFPVLVFINSRTDGVRPARFSANYGAKFAEPLRAMVMGAPLEDARHLAQRCDRMRQEAEAQAIEVSKCQAKARERAPGINSQQLFPHVRPIVCFMGLRASHKI